MKTKITLLPFFFMVFVVVFAGTSDKIFKNVISHQSNRCSVRKTRFGGGDVYIIKIFKGKMNYKVDTKNEGNFDFYLNSNFFTNTSPIGEVIVNGKTINEKVSRGGYFSSNGGNPTISLYDRPNSTYSTQTKYIGIKNSVLNHTMFKSKLSKWKTYRTLLGKDKDGNLILIHSGKNGLVSIEDICVMGKSEGMVNALIFDGGSSIEVLVKDGNYKHNYHSVSDDDKKRLKIHKPFSYITGKFI
jgi:hypothetical protein